MDVLSLVDDSDAEEVEDDIEEASEDMDEVEVIESRLVTLLASAFRLSLRALTAAAGSMERI